MLRLTLREQFEDLYTISPIVAQYCDSEAYQETFGAYGEYTANTVLQDCYMIILEELEDCGIFFTESADMLLGDWYNAYHVYILRYLIDEDNIINWIKLHPESKTKLEVFLDGDEDPLVDYLDYLINTYPNDEYIKELPYIFNEVYSTEDFSIYMKRILKKINDSEVTEFMDQHRVDKYIEKIKIGRILVDKTVTVLWNHLFEYHSKLDLELIRILLKNYDLDKLTPNEINTFAHIDLEPNIPETLNELKEQALDRHHKRSLHHIEYWLHNNFHPTDSHVLLLVAHFVEPDTTKEEFDREINDLKYKGRNIFTSEQQDFIDVCENILSNNWYELENFTPQLAEGNEVWNLMLSKLKR